MTENVIQRSIEYKLGFGLQTYDFTSRSGVFLREKDFTEFLSEIKRDESGNIVSASNTYIILLIVCYF